VRPAAVFAAAVFAAAPAVAAPPRPPDPAVVQAHAELDKAAAAILAFYPADARAKGVEGQATLSCRRTPQGALTACVVASETPTGAGFGDAALAIARLSPEQASVNVPQAEVDQPHPITFAFRQRPVSIEPNVLLPQVIQPPAWVGFDPKAKARFYPKAAAEHQISGLAILDCGVDAQGRVVDCAIASETPAGWDFGETALRMSHLFKMNPKAVAEEGGRVVIPIAFRPPF
jgi:TonB family protein